MTTGTASVRAAGRRAVGLLVLALVGGGCLSSSGGGGGGGVAGGATLEDYCARACTRLQSCDGSVDVGSCANECENAASAGASKLRSEYFEALSDCVVAADCVSLLDQTAYERCAKEARVLLAPTPAGQELCDRYQVTTVDCARQFDRAVCLAVVKVATDATVADATACQASGCQQVDACVDAAFAACVSCAVVPATCGDTCGYAADGVCDDGGPGSAYAVCALGTDCTDCGAR